MMLPLPVILRPGSRVLHCEDKKLFYFFSGFSGQIVLLSFSKARRRSKPQEICRHKGLRLSEVADRIGSGQSNLVTSVKGSQKTATKTGVLETLEFFSLVYDHNAGRFTLSLSAMPKARSPQWSTTNLNTATGVRTTPRIPSSGTCHKSPGTASPTVFLATFRSRALLTLIFYLYNYFEITLGDFNTCCVYIVNRHLKPHGFRRSFYQI